MVITRPIPNNSFIIKIQDMADEISFAGMTAILDQSESKEYTDITAPDLILKRPGRVTYQPITLSRGITESSKDIQAWRASARDVASHGANPNFITRVFRTVVIMVLNRSRDVEKRIALYNAWPSKLEIGDLNALDPGPWIETLELTYDYYKIS